MIKKAALVRRKKDAIKNWKEVQKQKSRNKTIRYKIFKEMLTKEYPNG